MKKLKPVDVHIDADMDADDLGKRIVDCIANIDTNQHIINVVKVHVNDNVDFKYFNEFLKHTIVKPLKKLGADNCIFIPLKPGFIEDITIDRIEVSKDESNN